MTTTKPSFRLDGRRALVIGASRGIGRSIAETMADAGAEVTLCARSADQIDETVRTLRAQGHKADYLVADVTDTKAFAEMISALPAFDILVNNAGTNRPKPLADTGEDDYDAVFKPESAGNRLCHQGRNGADADRRPGGLGNQYILANGPCRSSKPNHLLCIKMGA